MVLLAYSGVETGLAQLFALTGLCCAGAVVVVVIALGVYRRGRAFWWRGLLLVVGWAVRDRVRVAIATRCFSPRLVLRLPPVLSHATRGLGRRDHCASGMRVWFSARSSAPRVLFSAPDGAVGM